MKNNSAFTLVEIIVACAIFSGFLIGVFSIFRSGSTVYIAGNWKIQHQNKLRILMEGIKSDLEKANNVFTISKTTQTQIATTPIYLNNNCYASGTNSFPIMGIATSSTFVPIMFLSVTMPRVNASIFSPTAKSGKWYGSSLWGKQGKLYFTRTGKTSRYTSYPNALPSGVVSYAPPSVVAGGNYEPSARSIAIVIDDVESVGFVSNEITNTAGQQKQILKIRLILRRTRGGKSTNTTIEEVVAAKIQEETNIVKF